MDFSRFHGTAFLYLRFSREAAALSIHNTVMIKSRFESSRCNEDSKKMATNFLKERDIGNTFEKSAPDF